MNAKLLRAVLTHVTSYPALLDLTTFGEHRPSGDVAADIAGRALLESGWTLVADGTFKSPEGDREISGWVAIEREACAALGLSEDDLWGGGDTAPLFSITNGDEALGRLRELNEAAGAVTVNG